MQKKKKIAILIVAYNAENTLKQVIARIPKDVKKKVSEIVVFDDCSKDQTYELGLTYKKTSNFKKLSIYKNNVNLGYGGNQKKGYLYCISKGYDICVMLHGDGQYAPELLSQIITPLENGEADVVMGSRMLGNPLKGKMPMYKYLGNRFLTTMQNFLLGANLTEFHSGYRAYDLNSLKKIPFTLCSDNFHFDTEILIQCIAKKFRIKEIKIPTYYGNEISHVKVISYGMNVMKSTMQYLFHRTGLIKLDKYKINAIPSSQHEAYHQKIRLL